MNRIPYGRQQVTEEDIEAVVEVLRSNWLTQGPLVPQFEQDFSRYLGGPLAVAVSSGTAALHLSALALGIRPRDKVITTPITFAATANCIRYCGGEPVFSDVDPDTHLLDIRSVEALLDSAPSGTYKGILAVDFAGWPIDLDAFRELADRHGCWLMEDACHAPGGFFHDRNGVKQYCGNGVYADAAVFSFHPVKHIAAGEGGMVTTLDPVLEGRVRQLRTHGIQQDPAKWEECHGPWYYEQQELGYNYRLTDIQAALGVSQLRSASGRLERRRRLAKRYLDAFKGQPFLCREIGTQEGHAYHLFVAEFKERDGLFRYLREKGIFAQVHYIPLHRMPYYRRRGWNAGDFPVAEAYYRHGLSLPLYPSLRDEEQEQVIRAVFDYYDKGSAIACE